MKKTVTGVLALLAGAVVVHAQGTVSMANAYGGGGPSGSYITVGLNPGNVLLGGSVQGYNNATTANYASETAYGDNWSVELYANTGWNDASATLLPATSTTTPSGYAIETFNNGANASAAGQWYATDAAIIPNSTAFAGQNVTVQLLAWYNDGGTITSYAAAVEAGVPTGYSATANTTTGGLPVGAGTPVLPTALPYGALGNIDLSVAAVPEPSTIALGVLGASAFLMRLRRKN